MVPYRARSKVARRLRPRWPFPGQGLTPDSPLGIPGPPRGTAPLPTERRPGLVCSLVQAEQSHMRGQWAKTPFIVGHSGTARHTSVVRAQDDDSTSTRPRSDTGPPPRTISPLILRTVPTLVNHRSSVLAKGPATPSPTRGSVLPHSRRRPSAVRQHRRHASDRGLRLRTSLLPRALTRRGHCGSPALLSSVRTIPS